MEVSVIILLSIVCFVSAFNQRRCLYYNKKCVDHCPRNMHPYHMRCDGQTTSQRTCGSPTRTIIGYTCGWSRCDCNGNWLLDEDTGLCVDFTECPTPRHRPAKKRSGRRRKPKQSWRVPAVRYQDMKDAIDGVIREEKRGYR